jgi:IS30 family transposase
MKLYSIKEIADKYDRHRSFIWAEIQRGNLQSSKIGKQHTITEADAERWWNELNKVHKPEAHVTP